MNQLKKLILNGNTYIVTDESAVAFDESQSLSDTQKEQARKNIGAASAADVENEINRLDSRIDDIASANPGTGGTGGSIIVDAALDLTSTNPVQNKVLAELFLQAQAALEALTPDAALDAESTRPVQNKVICQQLDMATQTLEQIVAMLPTEAAINALIDAKLGVIENGTY